MRGASGQWTRRAFTQACAVAAASSCLGIEAFGEVSPDRNGFAYVACNPADGAGAIHVFNTGSRRWTLVETIAAVAPLHLERHPTLPIVYAVHSTDVWENLPRGAISAWTADAVTGRLSHLHTQPLALSATRPTHASITPDGRQIVVAVTGGGALNVLPIDAMGRPGPAHILRKEVGRIDGDSMVAARPHQVLIHPDGKKIFSVDAGNETVRSFGLEAGSLQPLDCVRPHPGAALSSIALSNCGRWVFGAHAESGSVGIFQLNAAGKMEFASNFVLSQLAGPVALAVHPDGEFLVTASSGAGGDVSVARIDGESGSLRVTSSMTHGAKIQQVSFSPDGRSLIAVESGSGKLTIFPFDPSTGRLGEGFVSAQLDSPVAILQTKPSVGKLA
jgi:6-phosphogluconolactonase